MACLFGHKWDGCKCARCGATRHDWDGCKCKACGETRDAEHSWDGCKCTKCAATHHEFGTDTVVGGKGAKLLAHDMGPDAKLQGRCRKCGEVFVERIKGSDNNIFVLVMAFRDKCPANRDGRCSPYGKDSGYACSCKQETWDECNVFLENLKYYGYWDL